MAPPDGGIGGVGGKDHRGPQLTDRDIEMLRWITANGVVNAHLVGLKFFYRPEEGQVGQRAAYRRLNALCRVGLILDQREYGAPEKVVRATPLGARVADVGV